MVKGGMRNGEADFKGIKRVRKIWLLLRLLVAKLYSKLWSHASRNNGTNAKSVTSCDNAFVTNNPVGLRNGAYRAI